MQPFSEREAVGKGGFVTTSEGRGDETKGEGRSEEEAGGVEE